jgi:hypothetical protein
MWITLMQACAIFISLASFVSGELGDGIAAHTQHEMHPSLLAFEPQSLELDRCEATVKAKMEQFRGASFPLPPSLPPSSLSLPSLITLPFLHSLLTKTFDIHDSFSLPHFHHAITPSIQLFSPHHGTLLSRSLILFSFLSLVPPPSPAQDEKIAMATRIATLEDEKMEIATGHVRLRSLLQPCGMNHPEFYPWLEPGSRQFQEFDRLAHESLEGTHLKSHGAHFKSSRVK